MARMLFHRIYRYRVEDKLGENVSHKQVWGLHLQRNVREQVVPSVLQQGMKHLNSD